MLRIGVLGAGGFSRYTIEAYRKYVPGIDIAAIASRTKSRAETLAADCLIPVVKDSNDELLDDPDLDAVVVITPPSTHFELGMAVLRRGKHLLIDKPISFTVNQANELVGCAEARDLQISTNLVLRVHPFHDEIRQVRRDKRLGNLLQITTTGLLARYPQDHWYWDETISGGFYLNTFSHFLDLYDFIVGGAPVSRKSSGDPRNGYTLVAGYENGVQATLAVSLQVSGDNERIRSSYVFENGVIETDGWLPETMLVRPDNSNDELKRSRPKDEEYQRCLAGIMSDFLDRIQHPEREPATGITLEVMRDSVIGPLSFEQSPM